MAEEPLGFELRDGVGVVRMDDGKANALSPTMLAALSGALDRVDAEAGAALIIGRPGRFSGGFDLSVMRGGSGDAMQRLVADGAGLFARMLEFPKPIVVACTGHAVAAGALLILSCDLRLGVPGDFKIGLNEVAISMTLPRFAVALAEQRLSKRHLARAAVQAELYGGEQAVDAGYLDRLVEPEALERTALEEAARLAQLPQPAFAQTKARLYATTALRMRQTTAEEFGGGR